jgi:ABC-type branched-subunit amino acid transport system substrate-binding protein
VLPLTDSAGMRDESEYSGLNAITLAVEEMNKRMGANGRELALYVCDTQRATDRAKEQAAFMAEQLKLPAILASGSQQCLDISAATPHVPDDDHVGDGDQPRARHRVQREH